MQVESKFICSQDEYKTNQDISWIRFKTKQVVRSDMAACFYKLLSLDLKLTHSGAEGDKY